MGEAKVLKELGKRLQGLRKKKESSVRKFSYLADLSVSYVQRLEAGDSNRSYTTLIKLAEALEVGLGDCKSINLNALHYL
ncbi:helix-turn-helix transcriptional regulator [uncultured Chitinophaga sp.]|jgi:Predicted transcriptional regulator with C-terminal CBS domains|uniref:helix-turn-helix domain-containing protein n=1 Tax=uncultured Chitinophaga sp. TaxID=339340 RepID=UPI0034544A3D